MVRKTVLTHSHPELHQLLEEFALLKTQICPILEAQKDKEVAVKLLVRAKAGLFLILQFVGGAVILMESWDKLKGMFGGKVQ